MKAKHQIMKPFWDHEKEEKWLNEMAAKGLAMNNYDFYTYTFEKCTPGEYIYRIELLKGGPLKPENESYIHFMGDNGVEHIDDNNSWVYFRKKAADGPFEIYSDLESKIKHYQRIFRGFLIVTIPTLIALIALIVFLVSILQAREPSDYPINGMILLAFDIVLEALLVSVCWRYAKRIKRLKAQRIISEQ